MDGDTGSGRNNAAAEEIVALSDLHGGAEAGAVSPGEYAVFDRATLASRLGGDEGSIDALVNLFMLSAADHLLQLGAALADGDAAATHYRAHTIGGTAGTMGALQMQEVAARLEKEATGGNAAALPSLYRQLQDAFAAFTSAAVTPPRTAHFPSNQALTLS